MRWYDEDEIGDAAKILEVLKEYELPILSSISRGLKNAYFLNKVTKDDCVLEIGCGDGWVGHYLRERGVRQVTGIDICPPAPIVGDIREWKSLGLSAQSFDVIIAFEVLEHVECMDECFALLKPGGRLMAEAGREAHDYLSLPTHGLAFGET
jgi:2-polyprenyl-3-methyl-5-hydroxy-6-metoxy-1,4-benzoquinol methylase